MVRVVCIVVAVKTLGRMVGYLNNLSDVDEKICSFIAVISTK